MPDATRLEPQPFTGTRCGEMVEGGLMSYRCEREQGHATAREDDPEPHYAKEIARSVRAWRAWKQREIQRQSPNSSVQLEGVTCPKCGGPLSMVVGASEATCNNADCDQEPISIAQAPGGDSSPLTVLMTVLPYTEPGPELDTDGPYDFDFPVDGDVDVDMASPSEMETKDGISLASEPETVEPTKQREGDQRLPSAGQECVQDRVIADMEESKRVGVERYGSVLNTFNGRSTIQDIHEEVRDLFVYLTQVRMEAEAERETLVEAVRDAVAKRAHDDGFSEIETEALPIAEIAVDRIMGWVVGQKNFGRTQQ